LEVITLKIIGFGGVFWRSKDVVSLKNWYEETLRISMGDWNGTIFKQDDGNETVFSLFKDDSDYFPKEQSVMLNFQVENIDAWIEHFNKLGVPLLKEPEKSEYGTFVWISDPDGRWIEIFEK
jgi:lactoylglutathione lyase